MRGIKTSSSIINECIMLRQNGASIGFICKTVGMSKSSVFAIIRSIPLTSEQRHQLRNNTTEATIQSNRQRKGISYRNQINLFPTWNEQFIYHISHFFFDGSITPTSVSYYNRSEKLVFAQKEIIDNLFNLNGKITRRPNDVLALTYSSVEFASLIASYKKQIFKIIHSSPTHWKLGFLKSFFDDEGNIYISANGNKRKVRGYQYDISLLELIQCLLINFNITSRIDSAAKCVEITGRKNIANFAESINFSDGLTLNPNRKNSLYKQAIEKKDLLQRAIESYHH